MVISRGLQVLLITIAISCLGATPLKRLKAKSARQVEFTTPSTIVEAKTGYPEAGFRPRIPFVLPSEEQPKEVTESVEFITTTTTESTLEDFDEIVPTTIVPEVRDHIPADTYGAPAVTSDDTEEIDAEVVPAPSEDFQPPSEEPSQDFASTFNVINNNDDNIIIDLPTAEQTSETEDLDNEINSKHLPADMYGAPEFKNEPKTDIETVEIELNETQNDNDIEVEQQSEGSAEIEFELAAEPKIQEPADFYGVPKTEREEDTELETELAEVEQQLEILSRLTQTKTGRLIILPVQNNLYLGRLVTRPSSQRAQRQNGRLLKL